MKRLFMLSISFLALISCNKEEVKMGNVYSEDGLKVTFQDFNDSRCPQDAVCVWQGEAEAYVKAEHDGETSDFFWLDLGVKDTVFNYEVTLTEMLPYPTADNHKSKRTAKFLINKL
jgi:hypothetical protein